MINSGRFRFAYFTPEYEATVAFYRDDLRLAVVDSWDRDADDRGTLFAAASGIVEVLSRPKSGAPSHLCDDRPPQGAFMVIEVPDVEQTYRRALARHLTIQQELTTQPWGHRAFCLQEPNGLTLYMFSETAPPNWRGGNREEAVPSPDLTCHRPPTRFVYPVRNEATVKTRIDRTKATAHGGMRAMLELQRAVEASGLEPSLLELLKIRASQINGCAFCIDMHTKDARARGESEQRIYALDAWPETPFFSPRERAALAWTEAVTLVAETRVPDDVYDEVRGQFDEEEIVALTYAVVAINGWNRLSISFRRIPGEPQAAVATAPRA